MLVALVFVLARNIVKLVVERRRGAAVRALPRQAGRAAARHDARAGGARADRRQRADSHEHRPLVQRADGRHPVVGRTRSPATTTTSGSCSVERPRRAHRARAGRRRSRATRRRAPIRDLLAPDVTLQRVQMVEVYRVGAGRAVAAEPSSRWSTSRRRRCRRGYTPRGRRSAGRAGARRLGRDAVDRDRSATSGDLLHAAAVIRASGRPADRRRRRDRLPDRAISRRARGA